MYFFFCCSCFTTIRINTHLKLDFLNICRPSSENCLKNMLQTSKTQFYWSGSLISLNHRAAKTHSDTENVCIMLSSRWFYDTNFTPTSLETLSQPVKKPQIHVSYTPVFITGSFTLSIQIHLQLSRNVFHLMRPELSEKRAFEAQLGIKIRIKVPFFTGGHSIVFSTSDLQLIGSIETQYQT